MHFVNMKCPPTWNILQNECGEFKNDAYEFVIKVLFKTFDREYRNLYKIECFYSINLILSVFER